MVRPDHRQPASDAALREIVRQVTESAPPAPGWDDLWRQRVDEPAPPPRPGWRQLALVAAVTALVVSGLWWFARPTPEPIQPVDTPASTTSVPAADDPATGMRLWVAGTEPIDVQLCLARVASNRIDSSDLSALVARSGLPGDSEALRQHVFNRPSQLVLAAVNEHPGLDAPVGGPLASVVTAYAALRLYDEEGQIDANFDLAMGAFLAERAASTVFQPDPASCWPETAAGRQAIDPTVSGLDDLEAMQCLAAAQLDHALAVAVDDPSAGFEPVVDAAALAMNQYFPSPPAELVAVTADVRDVVLFEPADSGERFAAARSALAAIDLPALNTSCPLMPLVDPAVDPLPGQPTSQPEEG